MKRRLIISMMLAAAMSMQAQQIERGFVNHLGIYAGAGTEGISVGLATCMTPYLELSAGVNVVPSVTVKEDVDVHIDGIYYGTATSGISKVNLKGDFKRSTFEVKAHVYPLGDFSSFFLTGGLSFGGEKLAAVTGHSDEIAAIYGKSEFSALPPYTVELDKYQLTFDRQGNIDGDFRVKKLRPYVGLGFGRLVPRNRVSFRVEAGCQFMGRIQVWQDGQELGETLTKESDSDFSKVIDKLKVYPVLRLTLTGRLF